MFKKMLVLVFIMIPFLAVSFVSAAGAEEEYPSKPITWIVPFGAGGATDTCVRTLAPYVEKYMPEGTTIVVENIAGAMGITGVTELYRAEPDGYTIGQATAAPLVIQPHIEGTAYSHDSFRPIARVTGQYHWLIVNSNAPYQTFEEWLDFAKENPGLAVGMPGIGSEAHLALEDFKNNEGLELTLTPYEPSSSAIPALLGNHITTACVAQSVFEEYFLDGEITPLAAVFSVGEKTENFADYPSFEELGYDEVSTAMNCVLTPKDVPDDRYEMLLNAFEQALNDPDYLEDSKKRGQPVIPLMGDELQKLITDTYISLGKIIKEIGL